MDKCLNCDKELTHIEGRKRKKYCDNDGKCKSEHWAKTHKAGRYYINDSTWMMFSKTGYVKPNGESLNDFFIWIGQMGL